MRLPTVVPLSFVLPLSFVVACVTEVQSPTGAAVVIEGVDYPPVVSLSCPEAQVQPNVAVRIVGVATDVEGAGPVTTLLYLAADAEPLVDELAIEHAFPTPGQHSVVLVATDVSGNASRAACIVDVAGDVAPIEDDGAVDDGAIDDGAIDDGAIDDGAVDDGAPALPDTDTDADGPAPTTPDTDTDAAPPVVPGLAGRMNATAYQYGWFLSVPETFDGEQAAEHAVDDFGEVFMGKVAEAVADTGFLTNDIGTGGLSLVPGFGAASPGIIDSFGVKYTGNLTPPAGAVSVVITAAGDDVVVVELGGEVVASADAEYAYDDARNDRAPAQTAALPVVGPQRLVLYVVDKDGPFAWDVAIRFNDAAGNPLGAGTITAD